MKVCTKTHVTAKFGEIPKGSLWADDSPYIETPEHFKPVKDAKAED